MTQVFKMPKDGLGRIEQSCVEMFLMCHVTRGSQEHGGVKFLGLVPY